MKLCARDGIVCRVTAADFELENNALRQQLSERDATIADRDKTIAKLARDFATLQETVKKLLAQRGGGHRVHEKQGLLFADAVAPVEPVPAPTNDAEPDDGSDDADQTKQPAPKKGTPRKPGKIDTAGLPSEDRVHDVPEEQRIDAATGKPLVKLGEKVFEELDYQRAQLRVIRHVQPIYGLPAEEQKHRKDAPVMADLPPRPLERCAASANLLAWLLTQKFANHLPLHRQEAIFGRDGLRLPKQTLCDWTLASGEVLRPIVDRLLQLVCSGVVLQLDDTPVMCQAGRGEPNFRAYLWTFVNPQVNAVVYRFTAGRASQLLADEIGAFRGLLIGDGYSGNRAAADKASGDIVVGGCWAHVARKFREAEAESPGTAKLLGDDIRALYAVEREADDAQLDREGRAALRRQTSRPILATIFSRTRRLRSGFSDAGDMAKAMDYVRNQRKALRQFLREGLAPIDNNACERSIRPVAIGRKNWLFAGSMRGGRAAAVIYSLVESCKLASVDVVRYFADVLVRVATHPANRIDELLPANWAARFGPSATACA
ncbi:MAG: IS66 family transposase [Planctomycetes bacterium]|nr:IS66 family transposase [Planctomycetota bacterium]